MSVSVSDGVLLGIVSKSKQVADHQETLREALNSMLQQSIVKDDEAQAVCLPNDPYSSGSDYYVGIFWHGQNAERSHWTINGFPCSKRNQMLGK